MSVTLAGTEAGTIRNAKVVQVPPDPQKLFDELCDLRGKLTGFTKMRRELLDENKRYGKLSEDIGSLRLQKKQIELGVDQEHESLKNNIQTTKDRILSNEMWLRDIALEQYRATGKSLDVVKKNRNGGIKKIRISFVPRFTQLSLFNASYG